MATEQEQMQISALQKTVKSLRGQKRRLQSKIFRIGGGMIIATREAGLALGSKFREFDYLYDACGDEEHEGYKAYWNYMHRRQLGRLAREILANGELDDAVYVLYENIPANAGVSRVQRIYVPQDNDSEASFYREYEGTGEFLYFKNSAKKKNGQKVSNPYSHFSNWSSYPELHGATIMFFDYECPSQDFDRYK